MGRIGRALASGQGFSNPFHGITGPTAWEPPLYPFLIAAVFKLFGIYSRTSAIILLSINSLFSALTCIPIFRIANRCFGATVARWSSWLWAVFPPIMFWSTRWIWETSLASLLLTTIFCLTLAARGTSAALARTRTTVGRRSTHEYFIAGVHACVLPLGLLPNSQSLDESPLTWRSQYYFSFLYCAVAGAQLRNFREIHLYSV